MTPNGLTDSGPMWKSSRITGGLSGGIVPTVGTEGLYNPPVAKQKAKTRRFLVSLDDLVEKTRRRRRGPHRWLILTHDNPDPDSIATAAAMQALLRAAHSVRATIGYGGIVGRAENQEMIRTLRLKLSRLRHLNWNDYARIILVDAQPGTGNVGLPEDRTADVVVDHHPLRRATRSVDTYDVRPDYGASATIAGEYLQAREIEISRQLATALVYAIRSETRELGREAGDADRALYRRLLPRVDSAALGRIQHPRLPVSYFATLERALTDLRGVRTLITTHLGAVDQPDIVPEIADLLVRMEGRTWALVTGEFEDRLYASLRTTNRQADAGRVMRAILGRKGRGGGHGMMAGGWLPLEDGVEVSALADSLMRKLAKRLNHDPERVSSVQLN